MISILDNSHGNILALAMEGKIDKADYDKVLPRMEQVVREHEKIRVYLEVKEIDRMSVQALWQEVKADIHYLNNFSKVAVIGDATWKQMLTYAASLLPHIDIRYFDFAEKDQARRWIEA